MTSQTSVLCSACGVGIVPPEHKYCLDCGSDEGRRERWALRKAREVEAKYRGVKETPRMRERSKRLCLDDRYAAWRQLQPEVYGLFREFARRALASGHRIGAKAIVERIRWEVNVERRTEFKVNNSYTSRMVRELVAEDERFRDYFETRKQQNER